MPNTITLKGNFIREEAKAGEAGIYPGMLIELDSNGDALKQTADGDVCEKAVAVEDALQGNTINTVYAENTRVQYDIYSSGSIANVRIASGETVSQGDFLVSNGGGTFRVMEDESSGSGVGEYALAVALDPLDMTASPTPDPFCRVRFL